MLSSFTQDFAICTIDFYVSAKKVAFYPLCLLLTNMYFGVIMADLSNPSLWQHCRPSSRAQRNHQPRQLGEKYIILEVKKPALEHLWDFFLCGYLAQNLWNISHSVFLAYASELLWEKLWLLKINQNLIESLNVKAGALFRHLTFREIFCLTRFLDIWYRPSTGQATTMSRGTSRFVTKICNMKM